VEAADANPSGDVYERYGTNLNPYALTKAITRLQLFWASLDNASGLDNLDNYRYIEELMSGRHVYLGEARSEQINYGWEIFRKSLILGASGCELAPAYRDALAPAIFALPNKLDSRGLTEAAKLVEAESADFVAGYADTVFAHQVATYLNMRDLIIEP